MTLRNSTRILSALVMVPFALTLGFRLSALGQRGTPEIRQQAEFVHLAERLAALRLAGGDDDQVAQDKALGILDGIVVEALNAPGGVTLESLNLRLAGLVTAQPGEGESFRARKLEARGATYALVANFGLAGPSAVRVYSSASGRYALAARVDRYAQKDFFDEYLELVPVAGPVDAAAGLFVTVAGRTDDLQTGAFTAWSFDGARLRSVWSTDLLQQSSYDAAADGFRLTYCAEPDEENPRVCRRMLRDRYVWDGASWKRVEQTAVPVPKR